MGGVALTSRARVEQLAARAWPVDDLQRRARKTSAVLLWVGVDRVSGVELTPAELAAVETVFGRIDRGELIAFCRADGSFELRRDSTRQRKQRGRRKAGRR